jgi:hypothetical protein
MDIVRKLKMVSLATKDQIPDDWITQEEAAELRKRHGLQGADKSQIYRWAKRGIISYRPVGAKKLVSRSEVLEYPGSPLGKPTSDAEERVSKVTKEARSEAERIMASVRRDYPKARHDYVNYPDGGLGLRVWYDQSDLSCLCVVPIS